MAEGESFADKMAKEEARKKAREDVSAAGYIGKVIAGVAADYYTEPKNPAKSTNLKGFKEAIQKDFYTALKNMTPEYNLSETNSSQFALNYDSTSETLEPLYFWILDKMTESIGKPDKLVDNFISSPGSGHFSELMGKATKMQEEAMKIMQTTGILIKSMINIIYDLKDFKLRLSQYDALTSKNPIEKESAQLALKQVWMDNVDMKRGAGSINALTTGQLNFVTLRDAFMAAKSLEDIQKMDLNDRVKRILEPRLFEFLKWIELSERELRKRYDIEKTYLKNQLSSLKLYTRWAKPYLKAASQLEQRANPKEPALVHAFNTIVLELTLFSKKKIDPLDLAANKKIPEAFGNLKFKRDYFQCVLVDFYFRGIPQRVGSNYVFGGRADVVFKSYALNSEEIAYMNKALDNSDLNDALKLVQGMTDDSIKALQDDINYFLEEEAKIEKEKPKGDNPFSALFGLSKKKVVKKEIPFPKPDSYVEKFLRKYAEYEARTSCFKTFDQYKKAHGMASMPEYEDTHIDVDDFTVWEKGRKWFSAYKP
jgi:hypothetical protein